MSSGGTNLDGVIFKITKEGDYTPLHHVNDNPPTGDLLLASDGKLYGTSSNGGQNLYGSIFRINRDGTGFPVIHNFNNTNGAYPYGGLIQADDGNLYGVTSEGGTGNKGTIFRIDLGLEPPPVNRAPIAINDYADASAGGVVVNVPANDFDPDENPNTDVIEEPLTVTIESQPSHGTASLEVGGQILYSPGPTFTFSDQFTYRVTDPDGLFAIGTIRPRHWPSAIQPMKWML